MGSEIMMPTILTLAQANDAVELTGAGATIMVAFVTLVASAEHLLPDSHPAFQQPVRASSGNAGSGYA